VHACPPLIAQGGAQCSEDAILLADYVTREGNMEDLLVAYQERRKPRLKIVVENTLKLAAKEIDPSLPGDPGQIMGSTMGAMAQPA